MGSHDASEIDVDAAELDDVASTIDHDTPDILDAIEDNDVVAPNDVLGPSDHDPLARRATRALDVGPIAANGFARGADVLHVCDGARLEKLSLPGLSPTTGGGIALPGRCLAIAAADDGDVVLSVSGGRWLRDSGEGEPVVTDGPDALGLGLSGGRIWAATGATGLASAPADLSAPATTHGLALDARSVLAVSETLYVADGRYGVKRFVIDGGGNAVWVASRAAEDVDTALAVLDDHHLVVARGGAGVGVLDVTGDGLELVGILELPGLASSVAVGASGLLMVASWTDVYLVDVTNVGLPKRLAREHFDVESPGGRRALGIVADGDAFLTLGLDHVTRLAVNPTVQVPELRMARSYLHIDAKAAVGKGESTVVLRNEGDATLEVRGLTVADPAFKLSLASSDQPDIDLVIPSEEAGTFSVRSPGTASDVTSAGFTTNDPDYPEVTIPVSVNPPRLAVGMTAPAVVLPELGGRIATLDGLRDPSGGDDPAARRVVYIKSFSPL